MKPAFAILYLLMEKRAFGMASVIRVALIFCAREASIDVWRLNVRG